MNEKEVLLESEISNAMVEHDDVTQVEKKEELFKLRCEGYSRNKKIFCEIDGKFKEETKILDEQVAEIAEKRRKIYSEKYQKELEVLRDETERLKGKIIETFPDEKTVKFEGIGRFTKKILKSIEVVDKEKLLAALVDKKMLSKGVKSFDTTFLKKSKEIGLFNDEEVKAIEKASLLFVSEKKDTPKS